VKMKAGRTEPRGAARRALAGGIAALLAIAPAAARAYDPATTHAGLTQKAAVASSLHRVLARRFARPLGLFEPLALHGERLSAERARQLGVRLSAFDPADGYRPDDGGKQSALGWLAAGSVLAFTPPEQGRNHFFDPSKQTGLDDSGVLRGFFLSIWSTLDGGSSLREFITGTGFDATGEASTAWINNAHNELGLGVLHDGLEQAVSGREPADREAALVQVLLAMGGVLSVLEDAGEPAHVRNDLRGAFLGGPSNGPWDHGSTFERWVADAYGRAGTPQPSSPVRRSSLMAYFAASDGQGLAQRTQRRFFSSGTVPVDVGVARNTTSRDVVEAARESLVYALPALSSLDLRTPEQTGYVMQDGLRVLAYRREPARVRFFLDDNTHADAARALLPEVGAYAAGLVDHVLRGELALEAASGEVTVRASGQLGLKGGTLRVFAEDAKGARSPIGEAQVVAEAASGATLKVVAIPAGTRRIAAVFRGEDDAGSVVASGEVRAP